MCKGLRVKTHSLKFIAKAAKTSLSMGYSDRGYPNSNNVLSISAVVFTSTCSIHCAACSCIRINAYLDTFITLYSTSDGLQPDEAVSVQSLRVKVALALEDARKTAPLSKLCVKVLAFSKFHNPKEANQM